jgi:hypothetical protein
MFECVGISDGMLYYLSDSYSTLKFGTQMKGEEFATIWKPPNHKLFDMNNKNISPILQCCIANQAQLKMSPLAPVFNITIGEDFAHILQPLTAAPPQVMAPPAAPIYVENPLSLLLHPSRLPGPEMDIAFFCRQFGLAPQTLKLTENCYRNAQVLWFVHVDDLKQMCFCMGEITGLQDAVEKCSVSRNA